MTTGFMVLAALTLVQRPETKFFDVQGDAPAKVRLVTTVKESLKSAGADESSRSPLYLNGHIVKYESMTSPADGRREIQTGEVGLKPGDVIAYDGKVLPLGLRIAEKPLEGAWLRAFQIGYESNERFVDLSGTKLTPARFAVRVKPICGLRGKFGVKAEVLDYWRKRVAFRELEADFEKDLELDIDYPTGATESYRAYLTLAYPDGTTDRWSFTTLAPCHADFHKRLYLDEQTWEHAVVTEDGTYESRCYSEKPPEGTAWRKVTLPVNDSGVKGGVNKRWFKTTFTVPPEWRGERYRLSFERKGKCAHVFVNGRFVGKSEIWQQAVPLVVDITDAIRPDGTNELYVACQERTVGFTDEQLRTLKTLTSADCRLADMAGPANLIFGNVWLESLPRVAIEREPRIVTSYEKKTIEVLADAPKGTKLTHRVLDRGREVVAPFERTVRWENPILWGPAEFPLLELESTLSDAATGRTLDVRRTRFGFREFGADGMHLLWNGKRVRGISRAMSPSFGRWSWGDRQFLLTCANRMRRNGNIMQRHCCSSTEHYDYFDEEGLLATQEPGMICVGPFPAQYRDNPVFFENMRKSCLDMVDAYPNHPAIITWYISNEFWLESTPEGQKAIDPVIRALQEKDPTRFTECGCDIDVGGRTAGMSTHYPIDSGFPKPEAYYPDAWFWRKLDQPYYEGMHIPQGLMSNVANQYIKAPLKWGKKPIDINETGWAYFMGMPHGASVLWGDEAYNGAAQSERIHVLHNRGLCWGSREAGCWTVTPWRQQHLDDVAVTAPEIDVLVLQQYRAFYEGTQVRYDIRFFHDVMRKEPFPCRWRLVRKSDGAEVAGERLAPEADFCVTVEAVAAFTAPAPGEYELVCDCAGGPEVRHAIRVFPRPAGDPWKGVTVLKASDPFDASVFRRAEAGEVIYVEPREDYPDDLPGGAPYVTKNVVSMNFTFRPDHPIVRGLTAADLSHWYPRHVTGRGYFDKPASGLYRTLVESGGKDGLCYSGLMELPLGKGALFLSRLELKPEVNPVAAQLLANLAAYRPAPSPRPLAALFKEGAPELAALTRMGVSWLRVTPGKAVRAEDFAAVYVDGRVFSPEDVRAAGLGGLRAVVRCPSEKWGVKLAKCPRPWYRGRCVKMPGFEKSLPGLTNFDFFWHHRMPGDVGAHNFILPEAADCEIGTEEILGARDLTFPRYLAERDGTLFETLLYADVAPVQKPKAERIVTTVFANLGVRVAPAAKLSVPKNLVFTPVDLTKFLDREIADEVDEDGVGGFSDQGPTHDLREWQIDPGVYTLGNGRFRIERPKTLFAMKSRYRRKGGHERVKVPVGRRADWLSLLHTSAFTGRRPQMTLVVAYADGTEEKIEFEGGKNVRDAFSPAPDDLFNEEEGTITCLALTVKQSFWGKGSVYSTAWKNPHPDVEIASVEFVSAGFGMPMVFALSTAVAGEAKEVDAAELGACCDKGDACAKAGDWAGALRWYQRSLELNYNQPPLWERVKTAKEQLKKAGK